MRIAVIADDLTGALDTGVQFRQWGYKVSLTDIPDNSTADVTIINTDTRNKTPEIAYQTTYQATKKVANHDIIYKKTDSTLRGYPGQEIQAILDASDNGRLRDIDIAFVLSNKKNAGILEKARRHNLDAIFLDPKGKTREEAEGIFHS